MSAAPRLPARRDERTAQAAAAGIQLAHAARHEVHEDVRVANFFIGAFAKFSVHGFSIQIEPHSLIAARAKAITKIPFKLALLSGIFSKQFYARRKTKFDLNQFLATRTETVNRRAR